jgi:hypothetical protein
MYTLAGYFNTAISACAAAVGFSSSHSGLNTYVTVTDTTIGSQTTAPFSVTAANNTNIFSWGSGVTNGNDGSYTCTGSGSAATFITSSSTATLASNLASAISSCNTTYPVVGATASYTAGNSFTITDAIVGNFSTFTLNSNDTGKFSWSSVTAGTNGSNTCPSSTAGTFQTSSNTTTLAGNLQAALALCPAAAGISSTTSTNTVTVTDTTPGAQDTSTFSDSVSNASGIFSWGTVTTGSDGTTNTCALVSGTTYTGTYETSSNTTTLAGYFNTAIGHCAASVGFSTSTTGATVTVTDTTPGNFTTFSVGGGASGVFSWGSGVTAGTNGSNACTSPTAGTFQTANATTTLASNLAAAINACNTSYPAVGATASYSSGSAFTITDTTPGSNSTFTFTLNDTNTSGIFSWSGVTSGSNGSTNTCSGTAPNFTGTYETSSSTTTLAGYFNTAIGVCAATVGFSTATSTNTVTVTDTTSGPGTTFSVGGGATGVFSWGTVTAGTTGSNICSSSTAGTYGYTAVTTTLASNIAAAINACNSSYPTLVTATANYSSGSTFKVTDTVPGATGTFTFTPSVTGGTNIFAWGTVTSGGNGTNACSGSGSTYTGTYATSSSVYTLADDLYTTINLCPTGFGITSTTYNSSGVTTVAARTAGTGGNSIAVSPDTAGYFAWAGADLAGGADGTTSGTTFAYWSVDALASTDQLATNIADAINANTTLEGSGGVTATTNLNVITVTANAAGTSGDSIALSASLPGFSWAGTDLTGGVAGAVGAGQYPAKFSFSTTVANCGNASPPDFVAYNTGTAGASNQASIIAFDNLYTGCTGTIPSVYWAYNTGGTILTSVVLSNDGTQLAFVHSSASGSSLVLLYWIAGEGAGAGSGSAADSPATPAATYTSSTVSSWVSCRGGTTSCQLNLPFSGTAANVTRSAPYYDNFNDLLYVGDDNGVLHKFTGVFKGTPGELTTGGWPLTVHSGTILTEPVEDANTNNVFVGDSSGRLSYVLDTGSTTGTCSSGSAPCLGSTIETLTTGPIADGPLVDPAQGTVYAFSGVVSKNPVAYEVLQSNESLSTSSSITFTGVSGQTYTSNARIGAFDNIYYTSGPSTGHLYVCAPNNNGSSNYNGASLYSIGFTSGVMNTTTAHGPLDMISQSPASGSTVDDCSPLTEFYTGTTDYLFVGVAEYADLSGCAGSATLGCLYNFDITSSFPTNSLYGLNETGNTSGIVIDNDVTTPETGEQIYFTNLAGQACGTGNGTTGNGTGGCAVQASQAAP